MDNKFNTNNLEDFFKKELHTDLLEVDSEGWDMPSDSVWDNIEEGIVVHQMPRRKWNNSKFWLSIAAAVLFITVCYQTLTHQQTIDDLQEQINVHANRIEQLNSIQNTSDAEESSNSEDYQNSIAGGAQVQSKINETTATKENNETNRSPNDNNEIIDTKVVASAQQENIPAPKNKEKEEASSSQEFDFGAGQNIMASTTTKDHTSQANSKSNHTNYLEVASSNQSLIPLSIDSKGLLPLNGATSDLKSKSAYQLIEPAHMKGNQRGMYVGTYYAPAWVSKKLKGEGAAELRSLVNHQKLSASSFQTGIKIGYQLSDKWSVETGLAYTKSQQKSEHKLNFAFDPDDITVNSQGDYEGTYVSNLSTSYGDMPVDVSLSHGPAPNLPEGTPIGFKLKSEQQIEMVQLPVSLRYSMGKGPLRLRLSAGATANVLTKRELKLSPPPHDYLMPGMNDLKHRGSHLKKGKKLKDMNDLMLSLTAGVEFDYAITDELHVYAAPTYAKGITPIYEKDDVETELSQATVLLGLNYYF